MKTKFKKYIFFIILIFVVVWHLFPEISLISKSIYFNSFHQVKGNLNTIQLLQTEKFSANITNVDIPNLDLDNSKAILLGSSTFSTENPEQYISFLDRIVPFKTIPFNNPNIYISKENSTVTIVDDTEVINGQTLILEVYLKYKDGSIKYLPQITSFSNGYGDLFLSRYSYLIQYIVWVFAIFGTLFSKKVWATVYDTTTKKPLSGAIVRIYSENRLVNTIITSVTGIIDARLDKGRYKLLVSKNGYIFPSSLRPLNIDNDYQNLYYGDEFNVGEDYTKLKLNVPMDREDNSQNIKSSNKAIDIAVSTFTYINAPFIAILAVSQILVWPTYLESWLFAGIGSILLLGKYIINILSKRKPGLVIDLYNKPVNNVEVTIYDATWNKKIDTYITSENGEYEFLVQPNDYYLTITNPNYKLFGKGKDKVYIKQNNKNGVMYINNKLILEKVELPTSGTTTSTAASTSETDSSTATTV